MKCRIASFLVAILFTWQNALAAPIHDAVLANDLGKIQSLLKEKENNINAFSDRGTWPLLIAVTYGHEEAVKLLLASGADVNQTNVHGYSALHEAAGLGYYEITKLLIQNNADIHRRDISNYNALNYAQMSGADKIIRLLKRHGAIE